MNALPQAPTFSTERDQQSAFESGYYRAEAEVQAKLLASANAEIERLRTLILDETSILENLNLDDERVSDIIERLANGRNARFA